jgi:hypothetical protein
MKSSRILWVTVAAILVLAVSPAGATDSHEYARDEYAVISDGLAPNKQMSLASHGEGELGDTNFHIWLMTEPAHRKIMALANIGSDNNLDTGPNAYHAHWSADSRRVAVSFRRERHALQLNIYNIEGRRAHLISGPSLFKDVTSRDIGRQEDVRSSTSEITWTGPNRFKLLERYLVKTLDPGFMRMLGKYGRILSKEADGALLVEFAAEADCEIIPGNRYRIVDLKGAEFIQ